MKKTNIHIANIIKKYGNEPTAENVADYCYIHYKSITGYATHVRDQEGHFPGEVCEIFNWFGTHFNYEFDLINSYWGNLNG